MCTPVENVLGRLDGVIPRGPDRWFARCPSHDDRSPSLAITNTGPTVLLHCFAGCSAEAVLDAIGLQFSDLYPPDIAGRRAFTASTGKSYRDMPGVNLAHERLILERLAPNPYGRYRWMRTPSTFGLLNDSENSPCACTSHCRRPSPSSDSAQPWRDSESNSGASL